MQLTQANLDQTLGSVQTLWCKELNEIGFIEFSASNELVFINFYAEWCRFSNILMPVFDEAADKVAAEFPEAGKVVMGKVDCDKENSVATRFHITKYPTLKVIRNGQPAKREYRGQRSTEAFVTFIKKQMEDSVKEFHNLRELSDLETDKRMIIGEKLVVNTYGCLSHVYHFKGLLLFRLSLYGYKLHSLFDFTILLDKDIIAFGKNIQVVFTFRSFIFI